MSNVLKLIAVAIVAILIGFSIATLVGDNQPANIGGSTSDSWSVGGNLTVDGTSTLTGAVTTSGDLTGDDFVSSKSTGTSTLDLLGAVSCIEMVAANGSTTAFYATTSSSGLVQIDSCN